MIKSIHIQNFKGFKDYSIDFGRVNLLVGGNNSGKTTIFHALQVIFWCIDQTADISEKYVTFRKTQLPEVGVLPYFNLRDIFYNQKIRSGRSPVRVEFSLKTGDNTDLVFTIYPAFSRNIMVDGKNTKITRERYSKLKELKPIFIPGTVGITPKEELYRTVAQERLITEGRQNQVLRNLVYRLRKSAEWDTFVPILNRLFNIQGLDVPFNDIKDEWLTAIYKDNQCTLDFVSAGSGFLQVVNLLSFLFLHTSRVALLDEPDSHLHDDLQKLTFELLDELSQKRDIQLIIATHSSTLIDTAGLDNVYLIDKNTDSPLRAKESDELVSMLSTMGISLPPAKIINTLRTRKCIFIEGIEADYDLFVNMLGGKIFPEFSAATRGLMVFETGGASKTWPFDAIDAFEKLIGVQLDYIYISDRDFFLEEQITEREGRAGREKRKIFHLQRRNRESYLLDPVVLEKVMARKWTKKYPDKEISKKLNKESIKKYILKMAKESITDLQTKFEIFHEPILKGTADHRAETLRELKIYFRKNYEDEIKSGRIPWRLLDSKTTLTEFRKYIFNEYGIYFSDKDILNEFVTDNIPNDVKEIVLNVYKMFRTITVEQARVILEKPKKRFVLKFRKKN